MEKQNSYTSSFKEFLFKILLPLFLIVGAAGLIFNYFFEKKIILKSQVSGAYKVNRILTETYPDEIPIFGSSRAEMGIIPDSLGHDYFNYGLYGTHYDVTLFFLEQECKKIKKRPWIILNLDLDGIEIALDDISNYIYNAHNPAVRELLGKEYKPYFSIPFIRYFGRFENIYRSYLTDKVAVSKIVDKGAAIEKQVIPQKEFDKLVAERIGTLQVFGINPDLKKKLFHIITTHPERVFVFVIAPYHPCCFQGYNFDAVNDFMKLLRSYKNVKVFDFSRLPLPDNMFFNTTHINYSGAVEYNHYLKDSLIQMGVH